MFPRSVCRHPEFALVPAMEYRQPSRRAGFRTDNFYRGIFALPGAAADWQIHPAVVWRRTGGLDDLPVVFSDAVAGRVRLCAFHLRPVSAAPPGNIASGTARRGAGAVAHHPRRCLEAGGRRESDPANSGPAGRVHRPAVFRPLGHRSPDATLVQPHQPRRLSLPALRALERRLIAGAGQLSGLFRDPFHAQGAGDIVGLGTGVVCHRLRRLRGETVAD